jgi:hypothetical protein
MGTLNGSMGMNKPSVYSIGIGAKVFDKIIYRSPAGGKDRYEYHLVQDDNVKESTYLHKLNSMIGTSSTVEDHIFTKHLDAEEMPYTEEAAQFFYDAIIAITAIAMKLDVFFKDKENLQKAIDGRTKLLGDYRRKD